MSEVLEIALSFFNIRALIQSDSAEFINFFYNLYPRSVTNGTHEPDNEIRFTVLTEPDTIFGTPVLIYNDVVFPLPEGKTRMNGFYYYVMREILNRVETHFLIHSGVVSKNNKGILLVGDACYGKTTLVLELVRRGYLFLSDEMAAISRSDKKVYPFPRCLSIRPSSLQNVDIGVTNEINENFGNYIQDIEELFPGKMGSPVPIGMICILSDPQLLPIAAGTSSRRLAFLWIDRHTPSFLSDLKNITGVTNLMVKDKINHSMIIMSVKAPVESLVQIKALCSQHHLQLMGISDRMVHKPDFKSPARLTRISHSQAAIFLLQRFMGSDSTLLKKTPKGRPTQLFAELTGLISDSDCYTLNVGPLDQMADLIDGLTL